MGGRFASGLKQAGYDALVVTGKANLPKYIFVGKGKIEIRDAKELIGKSPREVMVNLSKMVTEFEVCTTGIASENLVKYASIIYPRLNGRPGVAGRGGLGAVMGSKNLKAVVLKRGKEENLKVYSDSLMKDIKATIQMNLNAKTKHLTSLGTPFGVMAINSQGALRTKNATEETFEYAERISGEKLKDHYYRKNITCHSCPVACGKLCQVGDELLKNPEFETLYALGSMVGVNNLDTIIQANKLCDEYGLDTITMGVSIAFTIECFQRGILSRREAGGYNLRFGDGDTLLGLIEETSNVKDLVIF